MGESSQEVTWEDQQRINSFGTLNNRLHEVRAELGQVEKLAEDYEEASNELMIADEEQNSALQWSGQQVRYVLGECYVTLENDSAEERLQKEIEVLGDKVTTLKAEQSEILSQQDGLKKILYAKFGDNINLEEHDTL